MTSYGDKKSRGFFNSILKVLTVGFFQLDSERESTPGAHMAPLQLSYGSGILQLH